MEQGTARIKQSYIVRVPEDELDYHLPRIECQQEPGLPRPNIVTVPDEVVTTAEQQARDLLERYGVEDAQSMSTGDVVELANLIADANAYRKPYTNRSV